MGAKVLRIFVGLVVWIGAATAEAAPPETLDDVVILAKDTLSIWLNSRLVTGRLVVNDPAGVATLHRTVMALAPPPPPPVLPRTQLVANVIVVPGRTGTGPFLYDVFTNSPLDPRIQVSGDGPTAVLLPLLAFPGAPLVSPGTDACPTPGRSPGDCVVQWKDGPITLAPGNYNSITVKNRGALSFAGGTYHARSIRGLGNARLHFNGPTTLYIAERARFGHRTIFGPPSESTLNPRCIVMRVAGVEPVRFGGDSNITAMVEAPDAVMRLASRGQYRGQFVAKDVKVGLNATLEAAPVLVDPCN